MSIKVRIDYLRESLQREDINNFWKKMREIKKDIKPSIEEKIQITEEDKTTKNIFSSISV